MADAAPIAAEVAPEAVEHTLLPVPDEARTFLQGPGARALGDVDPSWLAGALDSAVVHLALRPSRDGGPTREPVGRAVPEVA